MKKVLVGSSLILALLTSSPAFGVEVNICEQAGVEWDQCVRKLKPHESICSCLFTECYLKELCRGRSHDDAFHACEYLLDEKRNCGRGYDVPDDDIGR